jgi:hypothetical protein
VLDHVCPTPQSAVPSTIATRTNAILPSMRSADRWSVCWCAPGGGATCHGGGCIGLRPRFWVDGGRFGWHVSSDMTRFP